jgi:ring-1,2-phenylacetyl-CoA epoxidase subunit PaaC
MIILLGLSKSKNDQVSAAANKIIKEELYHLRHAAAWLPRLGRGTDESHRRMQQAVNDLWPYVDHFFEPLPDNFELAGAGLIPEIEKLEKEFSAKVKQSLETASLEIPENLKPVHTSRINQGKVIEGLVVEMQSVARAFPNASW